MKVNKIQTEEFSYIELIAEDDKVLTQSKNVSLEERILGKKIATASADSISDWKEISNEDAEQLQNEKINLYKSKTAE